MANIWSLLLGLLLGGGEGSMCCFVDMLSSICSDEVSGLGLGSCDGWTASSMSGFMFKTMLRSKQPIGVNCLVRINCLLHSGFTECKEGIENLGKPFSEESARAGDQ